MFTHAIGQLAFSLLLSIALALHQRVIGLVLDALITKRAAFVGPTSYDSMAMGRRLSPVSRARSQTDFGVRKTRNAIVIANCLPFPRRGPYCLSKQLLLSLVLTADNGQWPLRMTSDFTIDPRQL